jgi:hypothetical protein
VGFHLKIEKIDKTTDLLTSILHMEDISYEMEFTPQMVTNIDDFDVG